MGNGTRYAMEGMLHSTGADSRSAEFHLNLLWITFSSVRPGTHNFFTEP